MNTQRAVSVALALAASGLLVTSSLGFTSVSADRGVQVNVVDAEDAYVGVVACEKAAQGNQGGGANPVRVWVTNQYSASFTVTAVTSDTNDSVAGQVPQSLDPGESERFESLNAANEVTVHVSGAVEATVTVDVYSKPNCPHSVSNGGNNGQGTSSNGGNNGQGTSSNGDPSTTQTTTATTAGNESTSSS